MIEALTVRSHWLLTSSSLFKEWEKGKKRNAEVTGRADDEIGNVKTKEKWLEKKIWKTKWKKDEFCGEEGENIGEQRGW